MATPIQVVFDANDPARLAEFWGLALGYVIQPAPEGSESWDDWARAMEIPEENWNDARALIDPDGVGPRLFFQRVPEGKTAKNRVHLDVNAGGGHHVERRYQIEAVEAHVALLLDAGASFLDRFDREHEYWVVMQDPEGNEFCVQ
jgi:hypothetical protein